MADHRESRSMEPPTPDDRVNELVDATSAETDEQTLTKMEDRRRHEVCDAMGLPRQTRFVRCVVHGQRGRVEEVYELNNWELLDGQVRCKASHPYCFRWCSPDLEQPQ